MKRQWKFHAMAMLIISGVILLLYAYMQSSKPAAVAASNQNTRSIEIVSATWGMNCNDLIKKENEKRLRYKLRPQDLEQLHPDDRPVSLEPMPIVVTNNVLKQVGELCNGKEHCAFSASDMALKSEPVSSCFKHLVVSFRCFSFDRLWKLGVGQGDNFIIDCHAAESNKTAQ